MKTPLFRTICTLALCALLAGCTRRRAEDDEAEAGGATPVVAVKVTAITRGDLETVVSATGTTDAIRKEKILAPIAGTLLSLKVLEGTPVRRGDLVAVIQPKEARAAITGAETLMRVARTEHEREEARRAMELARAGQNNLEVHAATDGTVAARSATEGELVSENAELMTVVDLKSLVFVADVPLRDLAEVRLGERAAVRFPSFPGRRFGARVEAVNPRSDPQSQTVRVTLRFTDNGTLRGQLLRAGMDGVAGIVTGMHPGVLIVPKSALLRNDETGAYTVVLAAPDSTARVLPVVVGVRTDSSAEVSGPGLAPGAMVVVEGNYALADSARIAPATRFP